MKKTLKSSACIILSVLFVVCLVACNTADKADVWEMATYRTDTSFGNGSKTATVEVKVEEESVVFTIKTDKDTVGEALFEHKLIDGEEGQYGLYVKTVNGITADYDTDKSYWAFYIDGEYAISGVDSTKITEGVTYQLVYTKE